MWGEDEDFSDHDYYNSIPGKEPPIGGVVDSRLRPSGALLGHIHTQPQSKTAAQVNLQEAAVMSNVIRNVIEAKLHLVIIKQYITYLNQRQPGSARPKTL